jgi:SAM-dependent methyltransferase
MKTGGLVLQTPSYMMRRRIILHLLKKFPPGRFLEIGCGRGELLPYLAELGFEGIGLEISPEAFPLAREIARKYGPRLIIVPNENFLPGERFKYIFAFEVLEHIQNDTEALLRWTRWLDPGGFLVISVPAHMKSWSSADDAVGHYRRYESDALCRLLERCGYRIEYFWNYGFPISGLMRLVRHFVYGSISPESLTLSKENRTLHSSIESTMKTPFAHETERYLIAFAETVGLILHLMQLPFKGTELGDNYLVTCRLRQSSNG